MMSSGDYPSLNSMNNSSNPPTTVSINSANQSLSPNMLSGGWVTVKVDPGPQAPKDNVTVTHFVNPTYDFSDLIHVPLIPTMLNRSEDSNLGPIKQPTRRQFLFSKIKQKCTSRSQKKAERNKSAEPPNPNPAPPPPQANPATPGMSSRSAIPLPSHNELKAEKMVSGFTHCVGAGTSNRMLNNSNLVVANGVANVPSHLVANTGGKKLGKKEMPGPSRSFIQITEKTSNQLQQGQQHVQMRQSSCFQNHAYNPVPPQVPNTVNSFGHGSSTVVVTSNNFNMNVNVGNSNFAPQIQPQNYQHFDTPGPCRAPPQFIHHPPPKTSEIKQVRKVMVSDRRLYYSAPEFIAPLPAPTPARAPAPACVIPEASNALNDFNQGLEWPGFWNTEFDDLMIAAYTHPSLEELLKLDVSEFAPISKDLSHYYSVWSPILDREV